MAVQHVEAFKVSPFSVGLDLERSQIKEALGTHVVDTTTSFQAGQLVQLSSTQLVQVDVGANPFGFAKFNYNATTGLYGAVVGEYVQLNGLVATPLAHSNLFNPAASGKTVRVAAALTGAAYSEATDYTIAHAAGTIVRQGGGVIPDGGYVYVNYHYVLPTADQKFHGSNFWNQFADDVTLQNDKITVITDWAFLFTTMYDPSHTYTVNGQLYAGRTAKAKAGWVCGDNTEGLAYIGRVHQIPTPTDPYLGIRYVGGMVS